MENQSVRRRVNIIASHLGSPEDLSATVTATHLFPMSCSNSLSSVIRRCDGRLYFARQTSSQACFMRQVSDEQGHYAQSSISSKSSGSANEGLYAYAAPMFSRPSTMEPRVHNAGELRWLQQACNYHQRVPDPPIFARPSRINHHYYTKERSRASIIGFEWLPKMDVAESGCNYAITIELPGVSASNIRMEIKNQKKEISQGHYEIVWSLPTNVNKDNISAEFVEGLLLITIPKLSEACSRLRKACI